MSFENVVEAIPERARKPRQALDIREQEVRALLEVVIATNSVTPIAWKGGVSVSRPIRERLAARY